MLVKDGGVPLLAYEVPEGQAITFHVGGEVVAYMDRVAGAPDGPAWLVAHADNRDAVLVEYDTALDGHQVAAVEPGGKFVLNPVLHRRWEMRAKRWE